MNSFVLSVAVPLRSVQRTGFCPISPNRDAAMWLRPYAKLPVAMCTVERKASETPKNLVYEDDGSRVIPAVLFISATEDQTIAGVYGILDEYHELVYVGMSRDVRTSLLVHAEAHYEDVCYVKVMTFALIMAKEMKRVIETWILDNETTPKGVLENWYEADEELAQQASFTPHDNPDAQNRIISPFENNNLESHEPRSILTLNSSNVDTVLDEVRPFLISDGGNVSVKYVSEEQGRVELVLEGACSSCSSATTTMQLGIEKALRGQFGENLREVVAVNATESDDEPSLQACERALDSIRGMVRGLGAEVSVLEVDDDEVIISFSGPSSLRNGVEQTLLQKVSGIQCVTFE